MDKSSIGGDSFWAVVPAAEPCLRFGLNSASPTFNLLGHSAVVSSHNQRPILKLMGADRTMPPLVASASQLVDPTGRIEADWKVTGQSCTILPGVTLDFAQDFGLIVFDDLFAQGTEEDSIRFTGTSWNGVQSALGADDHMELDYCVVENTRSFVSALSILGTAGGERSTVRHTRIRNALNSQGLFGGFGAVDVDGLHVSQCAIGVYIYAMGAGTLRNVVCTDNADYGLLMESSAWTAPSIVRNSLFTGNGEAGIRLNNSTLRLEQVTSADNVSYGLEAGGQGSAQLVNCVLSNPGATHEVLADSGPMVVAAQYSTVRGGAARCMQAGGAVVVLNSHVLTANPQLDATYHPLPGSPVIDAGSPQTAPDPDLTVADQGCFFFDQRAPLALSAVDIPEDQGGRLQFLWNASSMDLAQASDQWFYSVWRLDTLFNTQRSALPVVHTRRQVEAAISAGQPFTWQRDGAAWNWLATVPAAQFAQYALVVETLADRLDGQPWETPLRVLWHAQDVLAESATVYGTSVDNVPPDAPQAVASVPSGSGNLRLAWQPVSTGTVNGQALAERNGVVYHVYEVPVPYAPGGSGTFLGTTAEPEFLLPIPAAASQRFFRVKADDTF
jgi:hypothetical protein